MMIQRTAETTIRIGQRNLQTRVQMYDFCVPGHVRPRYEVDAPQPTYIGESEAVDQGHSCNCHTDTTVNKPWSRQLVREDNCEILPFGVDEEPEAAIDEQYDGARDTVSLPLA